MSPEIARISKNYLHNAKEITIGRKNESTSNVKHVVYTVHAKDKYAALKRIVDYYPQIYGIIFCRTRKETQEIADKLMQEGYNADSLHGELSQAQRDTVMQKFRIRNIQILVATDVAARGLDEHIGLIPVSGGEQRIAENLNTVSSLSQISATHGNCFYVHTAPAEQVNGSQSLDFLKTVRNENQCM